MGKGLKTHKGASKRFRVTGSGKIMRAHAYSGHHFMKKSKSALRVLKSLTEVDKTNLKAVKRLIPHSL